MSSRRRRDDDDGEGFGGPVSGPLLPSAAPLFAPALGFRGGLRLPEEEELANVFTGAAFAPSFAPSFAPDLPGARWLLSAEAAWRRAELAGLAERRRLAWEEEALPVGGNGPDNFPTPMKDESQQKKYWNARYTRHMAKYRENKDLRQKVKAWQKREDGANMEGVKNVIEYFPMDQQKKYPHLPVFEVLLNTIGFGTMIHQNDDFLAFIPSGFTPNNPKKIVQLETKTGPMAFPPWKDAKLNINYPKFENASSLQSLAHFLVISKKRRIYNAVELEKKDVSFIKAMLEFARQTGLKLWNDTENPMHYTKISNGSLFDLSQASEEVKKAIPILNKDMWQTTEVKNKDPYAVYAIPDGIKPNWQYSFHVHDHHSQPYLHMQVYAKGLATRYLEEKAFHGGEEANFPVDRLLSILRQKSD